MRVASFILRVNTCDQSQSNVKRFSLQMWVGMVLASTNPVPPRLRGKLSGLFLMSQSLGRTIGPMAWAVMYTWSISPSGGGSIPLIDHRFIFTISAILSAVAVAMSWSSFTEQSMTHVVEDPLGSPSPPRPNSRELAALDANSSDSDQSDVEIEPAVVKDRRALLV